MSKRYQVQLACGHLTFTTAEPSTGSVLSLDCKECGQVQSVSRWTGEVEETPQVTTSWVKSNTKVEENSD